MSTERFELIAPCHFGLEAVLKREILDLGYEISKVEDGKLLSWQMPRELQMPMIFLRTTERILLKIAEVKAETFDELFEATKALPWERYIPADGKFWIAKANSVKSKLFSPSDIQSIMKKSHCRASEGRIQCVLVPGGWSKFSYPCGVYEGCGNYWNRYFRCFSS